MGGGNEEWCKDLGSFKGPNKVALTGGYMYKMEIYRVSQKMYIHISNNLKAMFIKIHSVLAKAKKNTSGSYTQHRNFSLTESSSASWNNGSVANVNEDKMLKEKHMDVWSCWPG